MIKFSETQRFTQKWLWALMLLALVPTLLFFIWGTVQQLVFGIPFGDHPASDAGLVISSLVPIVASAGAMWLVAILRLETTVDDTGVYVQFRPLHRYPKHFRLDEIASAEARTYSPVREYGGWGIKGWSKDNMAYNVRGDRGLQLVLTSGRRILIGSQRADELAEAVHEGLENAQ